MGAKRRSEGKMLPEQPGVSSPAHSKANLLTLGCSEGKCNVYCRHQTRGIGS